MDGGGLVKLANELLAQLNVSTRASTVEDIDSSMFVILYEGLCGERIPDVIRKPRSKEDEIHNCQCVIDSLAMDILHTSLSHITGEDVAKQDATAIHNLLEIFSGLMEFILNKIECDFSSENGGDRPGSVDSAGSAILTMRVHPSQAHKSSGRTATSEGHAALQENESRSPKMKKARVDKETNLSAAKATTRRQRKTPQPLMRPLASSSLQSLLIPSGSDTNYDTDSTSGMLSDREGKKGAHTLPRGGGRVGPTMQFDLPSRTLTIGNDIRNEESQTNSGAAAAAESSASEQTASKGRSMREKRVRHEKEPAEDGASQRPALKADKLATFMLQTGESTAELIELANATFIKESGQNAVASLMPPPPARQTKASKSKDQPIDFATSSKPSANLRCTTRPAVEAAAKRKANDSMASNESISQELNIDGRDSVLFACLARDSSKGTRSSIQQLATAACAAEAGRQDSSSSRQPALTSADGKRTFGVQEFKHLSGDGFRSIDHHSAVPVDECAVSNYPVRSPCERMETAIRASMSRHDELGAQQRQDLIEARQRQDVPGAQQQQDATAARQRWEGTRAQQSLTEAGDSLAASRRTKRHVSFLKDRSRAENQLHSGSESPLESRLRAYLGSKIAITLKKDNVDEIHTPAAKSDSDKEVCSRQASDTAVHHCGHLADESVCLPALASEQRRVGTDSLPTKVQESPKKVRFEDLPRSALQTAVANLERTLGDDEKMSHRRKMVLGKVYQNGLEEIADERRHAAKSEKQMADLKDAAYRRQLNYMNSLRFKGKMSHVKDENRKPKGYLLPRERVIRPLITRTAEDARESESIILEHQRQLDPEDDNFIPALLEEFPHVHVAPETIHDMWRKHWRQAKLVSKAAAAVKRNKSRAQAQIDEAERKQRLLMCVMKKDILLGQRMRQRKLQEEAAKLARRGIEEKRLQSARVRRYYDEYAVQTRSKMLRSRTREEQIFKDLFKKGLEIQKERIRELRKYARESRGVKAAEQQTQIESLENYYRDQFNMVTEAAEREQGEWQLRERAQTTVLNQIKKEMRQRMEKEIEHFQNQLLQDEDDAHFRQLDADRLQLQLKLTRLQTGL